MVGSFSGCVSEKEYLSVKSNIRHCSPQLRSPGLHRFSWAFVSKHKRFIAHMLASVVHVLREVFAYVCVYVCVCVCV